MSSIDEKKKAVLIAQVAELHDKSMSKVKMSLYLKSLKSYSAEEVEQALEAHIGNPETGRFMPKPADIVQYLTGGTQTQSLLAWTHFEWAIERKGTNRTVCFEDDIINQVVVDMGGWISFEMKTYDEWPYLQNEFEKRYRGYLTSTLPEVLPDRLIGAHDHSALLNGLSEEEMTIIECKTRYAIEKRKRDQANQQSIESKINKEIEDGSQKVTSAIKLCANELREDDMCNRGETH